MLILPIYTNEVTMSTLILKLIKDTVLTNIVLSLLKEGASRTSTPYDDYAVKIVEQVLKGDIGKDILDDITNNKKK